MRNQKSGFQKLPQPGRVLPDANMFPKSSMIVANMSHKQYISSMIFVMSGRSRD